VTVDQHDRKSPNLSKDFHVVTQEGHFTEGWETEDGAKGDMERRNARAIDLDLRVRYRVVKRGE
jgi:hypothetical protein